MGEMIRGYKKDEVIFAEGTFENAMSGPMGGTVGIYANYEKPEKRLAIMSNISRRIHSLAREYLDVCRTALEMCESEEMNGWLKRSIRKIFADCGDLSRQKSGGRNREQA